MRRCFVFFCAGVVLFSAIVTITENQSSQSGLPDEDTQVCIGTEVHRLSSPHWAEPLEFVRVICGVAFLSEDSSASPLLVRVSLQERLCQSYNLVS